MMEFNKPKPQKRESDDCEIKVKRDTSGRIVGIKRSGKCSKEDLLAFSRENNFDLD